MSVCAKNKRITEKLERGFKKNFKTIFVRQGRLKFHFTNTQWNIT